MTPEKPFDHNAQITELWDEHHEVLEQALARWSGRSRGDQDVQEAIAAAFERTLRYLAAGRTLDSSPRGWLITVTRREFQRTVGHTYNRTAELDSYDTERALADPAPQPDEILLDQAQCALDGALSSALGRLTPRQRDLLLDVHAGYSYSEITQRHDVTLRTLNKQLTKARTKLRNDLQLARAYREWSD